MKNKYNLKKWGVIIFGFFVLISLIIYVFILFTGLGMKIPKSRLAFREFHENLYFKNNIIFKEDSLSESKRTQYLLFSQGNKNLNKNNIRNFSDSLFNKYQEATSYRKIYRDTIIFDFKLLEVDTIFIYVIKK